MYKATLSGISVIFLLFTFDNSFAKGDLSKQKAIEVEINLKGKTGKVLKVIKNLSQQDKAIVEGVNIVKKHTKQSATQTMARYAAYDLAKSRVAKLSLARLDVG